MTFFLIKAVLSGVIIAVVSSVARRSPAAGAFIASLPLISVMGMIWLWVETKDPHRMQAHVNATFWYVLPSLPMFLLIPAMMRAGVPFYAALGLSSTITIVLYCALVGLFGSRIGISH